ncbi:MULTISPECIES: inositol monophosphatase family protein [unclassified Nitratiruptor]|uniref:inositol monophosphatase family protein n=1 Tax=unclassified Nitratiruptor TaxID=2624044 RepID=UPI001914E890|nr:MULTISPECIES: inositol monophosphatase family protein [unclassified Nitratiruptor]BCD60991.1 myo-inositol-1(or 4)-monophosphatase [Nitratiruptor sp. YY08-10]BCD64923.1 myo-inositol-1(or 4)-monophosphatase [Nitratiruptor sp. YY08-14]
MNRDLQNKILEAGAILKEGYFGKKEVHKKGSVDLVTQYDTKIENFLKEKMQIIYPGVEIVGEESFEGEIPNDGIYIDPIDGTTNFVHSIAYTCISVGVWQEGEPLEAVIYNPILNELFYAKKGAGAYLNDQKIAVNDTENLIDALLATGFPYTKVQMGKDYRFVIESMQKILPKTRDIRRLGSAAIDLAYVACGRFAGFYEVNLKPWDVAAGILLVQEAGGIVTNHLGEPYKFGDIIVASNGKIHEELLKNLGAYN